jgi:hypothetical protein
MPTLAEVMDEALTRPESEELTRYLRPLVERGEGTKRQAAASLQAVK